MALAIHTVSLKLQPSENDPISVRGEKQLPCKTQYYRK